MTDAMAENMNVNRFFALIALMSAANLSFAQEEGEFEPPFREAFFMSELEEDQGLPQAVRVGGVVFVSATSAPGDSLEEQLKTIYIRIQSTLGRFGLSMVDVAQERIYTTDLARLEAAFGQRLLYYTPADAPATSWLEVARLPGEGRLLAIEVIAVAGPQVQ